MITQNAMGAQGQMSQWRCGNIWERAIFSPGIAPGGGMSKSSLKQSLDGRPAHEIMDLTSYGLNVILQQ
jgi:hypothetical protein